jgi:glycyl-tRNA synthetase beta chain
VLQMLLGGLPATLDELIAAGLAGYEGVLPLDVEGTGAAMKEFFLGRLEKILRDRGHAYDTVDAVLASCGDDPADASARCEALGAFRASSSDMEDLSVAFTRAKNLARPELGVGVDVSIMGPEELALSQALDRAENNVAELASARAYSALLETFAGLRGPIDAFFEGVMVMSDVPAEQENRLRLLNRFVALFGTFADFSLLSG